MSTLQVLVSKVKIEEHPNADALELAIFDGYKSAVRKGIYKTGDLVVYIPEASIVPEWVLKKLNLWDEEKGIGKLAGSLGNRVKPVKLRSILSEGIVYPLVDTNDPAWILNTDNGQYYVNEGQDVAELLGIVKWEPPIPVSLSGEVFNAYGKTIKYDIENFKRYPNVIKDGDEVVFTEKIHGTWCCFGYHPSVDVPIVTSKGLSAQGLSLKFNKVNENNAYMRTFNSLTVDNETIIDRCKHILKDMPFYILGEVFGNKVQDLEYTRKGQGQIFFRVFDVYVGQPQNGKYLSFDEKKILCDQLSLDMVPVLYIGRFSNETMLQYTKGKETVSGEELHIREGIVITPLKEQRHVELGRVILKSVSEDYLSRKNGTEYN